MLPVVWHEPQYVGRVGGALSAEDGRKAAEIAFLSALSAARAYLGALDKITGVAKLGVLSLRSRADLSLVVSVAPTMCVGRSRRLTPPLRRRPLLLPDEALCQRSGPLEDQAGVCKRTSAGGGAALGRRTQWHQLQHRPQLRTGDRRRHCRVGRGGRRIRHECASLPPLIVLFLSGASKDGIVISQPPPPRPPLIRQRSLRPPASCVVILAHLVLVRLHLGQDVENVGEDFLHGPQFRFSDGETGEQGGLQTYTPTSLCTRPSSAPSGTPGLLPRVLNGTRISAPSFRLNRVFRSLLGARSARPEGVAAAIFPASPFRLENEMAGTDRPPREAPARMTGKSYRRPLQN